MTIQQEYFMRCNSSGKFDLITRKVNLETGQVISFQILQSNLIESIAKQKLIQFKNTVKNSEWFRCETVVIAPV